MQLLIALLDLAIFNPQGRVFQLPLGVSGLMDTNIDSNVGVFARFQDALDEGAGIDVLDKGDGLGG